MSLLVALAAPHTPAETHRNKYFLGSLKQFRSNRLMFATPSGFPSKVRSVSLPPQQPLTAWWDRGVRGPLARLRAGLAARRGVAWCPFPPETVARPVRTSGSAEDALGTTPSAAVPEVRAAQARRSEALLHSSVSVLLAAALLANVVHPFLSTVSWNISSKKATVLKH